MDGSTVKKFTLMTERGRRRILRPVKRKASQPWEVKQITHLLFVFVYKKSPYPPNMEIIIQNVQGKLRKIIIVADEAETLLELNATSQYSVVEVLN